MKVREFVDPTMNAVAVKIQEATHFAKLERVLAILCVSTPLLFIWSDGHPLRASISAYYDMKENELFYVPLTIASMLFVVNGVVKNKHLYNTILGVMLAGVLLFNHVEFTTLHALFAIGFFAGNAIVIVVFTTKIERLFKVGLVIGIVIAMLGFYAFDWFTLFWAEWLSFVIIGVHYTLESWGVID
jgi:hypothetical protein